MSFFIKVIDGVITNHPMTEENILEAYELSEVTQAFLEENNLVKFEQRANPMGTILISREGYEMGDDGIVRNSVEYVEMTQEQKVDDWVRGPRNFLLARSDWTQTNDSPLSAEKKAEWANYRQVLRDLTSVYAEIQSPDEIDRPVAPE